MLIGEIKLVSTLVEDERLRSVLHKKYSTNNLSTFVNAVINNKEVPIVEVSAILESLGYSDVPYDDIDAVMLWSRQILSQRESEVKRHANIH